MAFGGDEEKYESAGDEAVVSLPCVLTASGSNQSSVTPRHPARHSVPTSQFFNTLSVVAFKAECSMRDWTISSTTFWGNPAGSLKNNLIRYLQTHKIDANLGITHFIIALTMLSSQWSLLNNSFLDLCLIFLDLCLIFRFLFVFASDGSCDASTV